MTRAIKEKLFKAYEDGKSRRYQLLFAVHGGAFAVARLLGPPQKEAGGNPGVAGPAGGPPADEAAGASTTHPLACLLNDSAPEAVLGGLSLGLLSLGMVLFTAVMLLDLFEFGQARRKDWERFGRQATDSELFGWSGKVVLGAIGGLLLAGWLLVAFRGCVAGGGLAGYALVYSIRWLWAENEFAKWKKGSKNPTENTVAQVRKLTQAELHEAVSRKAYEIWEKHGRQCGDSVRNWLEAKRELGVPDEQEV